MGRRFRDYSVRAKIAVAFVCVLATTIALGFFAIERLSQLDSASEVTSSHWVPATQTLAQLQYNMTRYRSFSSTYLLPGTDEQHEDTLKLLKGAEAKASDAVQKYRQQAVTDQERQFADQIAAAWSAYDAMRDNHISLFKAQGLSAAAAYFMGPMRKSFGTLNKAVDAALSYSSNGAIASGNTSHETYASSRTFIFGALAFALLLSTAAGFVLVRMVSVPLVEMTGAMGELAAGRLDAAVPHADQLDEVGRLAEAMTSFKNQLAAAERSKAEQTEIIVSSIGAGLDSLAKGDLTHRVTANLLGPFAKLKSDFNAAMERLQETLKNVLTSTNAITGGAGEVSQASDDLSRRTEKQAASLEETAAALEEITATVKKTASNAREANTLVDTARSAAENGGSVVNSAVKAMDQIQNSSKQIVDIIGVIDEIAFQTNLLALNAGVEAARAGDAGRGFAVVASEVRGLAQRSGEAAKQIRSLIHASTEHVESGVTLVGQSGDALDRIIGEVAAISRLVTEMAQAAQQQSSGIEQVNTAVAEMDQVTQQNAAMVEESTAALRNLAGETKALAELVAFFQVGAVKTAQRTEQAPVRPHNSLPKPAARRVTNGSGRVAVARKTAPELDDWTEF